MNIRYTRVIRGAAVALFTLGAPGLLLPAMVQAAEEPAPQSGPQETMVEVARRLFVALDANRPAIRKNPEAVYPLVDQILLPQFDVDYAAQLVLAQYWRSATPEQREHFIHAFYGALLRTYGAALADATADRMRVLPFRGDPAAAQVTIRTEVTRASGGVIPVDYRLRKTADGWKAFDVIIEGISYVRNYRTDLDSEIAAKGLDAVIARIEKQGLTPATSKAAGP